MSSLTVLAITHDKAPFDLLEQVALDAESSRMLAGVLVSATADEAVVLSTCNRTEIYLAGDAPDPCRALVALAGHTGVPLDHLARVALTAHGDDAALHLFRVACGLESRMVGEGQILGQVRRAIARATASGSAGPELAGLFRFAAAAGRRARRATGADTAPSLASIALDAARPAPGAGSTVVLGAGEMASAVVTELAARRLDYLVWARQPSRAARLAWRADQIVDLQVLPGVLETVDLVVCATSARTPLLLAHEVATAMHRRCGRPLTIVDLSLPRNVDPSAASVPGVRLIDLEGLTADRGQVHLLHAARVVAADHERYRSWLAGRAAGALIAQLRERVRENCRIAAGQALAGADEAAVDRLANRMAGKLLHGPTVALKGLMAEGDVEGALALLAAYGVHGDEDGRELQAPVAHLAEAS